MVVGWCRLGCGEGYGVWGVGCVWKSGCWVCSFLAFPFLRFVGEQCGACAAAGAVRHRGTQGAGLRGATGGGSIGCDTWGGAHWVLMRVRLCVTHRAGHEQT